MVFSPRTEDQFPPASRRLPRQSSSLTRGLPFRRPDQRTWCDLLQVARDNAIALGDAGEGGHGVAIGRAERHDAPLDLVAFPHDVDILANLARPDSLLRHHQTIGPLTDMP